jgi:hypothetical protein
VQTLPDSPSLATLRRARLFRRAFLVFVAVVVGAGDLGLLGVKTATRSASAGGYDLEVRFPRVIRPGLAATWSLDIHKAGGFADGELVRVRLRSDYFDMFDENGFDPDPVSSTSDGTYLVEEFEAPRGGDTLSLSFDSRVEPGVQKGTGGDAAVVDDAGAVLAQIYWSTIVVP